VEPTSTPLFLQGHGGLRSRALAGEWDYLVVSASNARQASTYEAQLRVRRELGLLAGIRNVLVVPDPAGKRVGSGGSTVACLMEVLGRELDPGALADPDSWRAALSRLRILIVHGGGDSMRLPAYGGCGKVFTPVPGESDSALGATLFDRQLPTYLALPPMGGARGQVVVTSCDVLLVFDPATAQFAAEGVTGLGALATPEQASGHGVYCTGGTPPEVRLFLQKPAPARQAEMGAINRHGQVILDVGVFSFDAATAARLLHLSGVQRGDDGSLAWSGEVGAAIESRGLDFYREVCCALGSGATPELHAEAAWAGGSRWEAPLLRQVFDGLAATPFHVQVLPSCGFLHFGTTEQLLTSGLELVRRDGGEAQPGSCLGLNTAFSGEGRLVGTRAWVEGCRVRAPLALAGDNVVTGVDVDEPLSLPAGGCLDVTRGRSPTGRDVVFVRPYGVHDMFKDSATEGATFCGQPAATWLEAAGARAEDVWDAGTAPSDRRLWNARLFPAEVEPAAYRRWLWMLDPATASTEERDAWLSSERYSLAEMAELVDPAAFHERRMGLRAEEVQRSLHRMLRAASGFSAADLACVLAHSPDRSAVVADLLGEAHRHHRHPEDNEGAGAFALSRILHAAGSALEHLAGSRQSPLRELVPRVAEPRPDEGHAWLAALGLAGASGLAVGEWADRARAVALSQVGRTIIASRTRPGELPKNAIRADEIVWGRAPARLDVGGGWTDTPPYSLERGGCVVNAAVDINGQPPIQAYARVIQKPVVRITSIDLGERVEITDLDQLLDFRTPGSEFALAKAALALSGLSPETAEWPAGATLPDVLAQFGGGIELTTLAAIPKGSGLGTSSIMGAVLLAAIQRAMGRTLTRRELFHDVLRLEQALTTGGGWQDQIGGVTDGVKWIEAEPGLVPDTSIHYLPPDVLDPRANGGRTLLYYTGLTRLAKSILQQVVGRYLDRDRAAMATLAKLRSVVPRVAEAIARKDLPEFGRLVDLVWHLNCQLDPGSTNGEVEALLARVRPHVHGAKLLGAGGGGFLFMVCKSQEDAAKVRTMLDAEPLNAKARFFDYAVSRAGLTVTVC